MADRFSAIANSIRDELDKEEPSVRSGVRLFIPTISDKIILTKDWYFKLARESRNNSLLQKWFKSQDQEKTISHVKRSWDWWKERDKDESDPIYVLLPAGTILTLDRVYIRGKGADYRRFDSITFRILKGSSCKELVGARFWANLRYVNQIECDLYKPEK